MGEKDALGAKARNQAADGRVNGIVFDAGGLMAVERNDSRIYSILDTALEDGISSRRLLSHKSFGTRPGKYAFGG